MVNILCVTVTLILVSTCPAWSVQAYAYSMLSMLRSAWSAMHTKVGTTAIHAPAYVHAAQLSRSMLAVVLALSHEARCCCCCCCGNINMVQVCVTHLLQVRSAKLGSLPLTSLALLHQQGQATAGHPVVLSGSYDNHVSFSSALHSRRHTQSQESITFGHMRYQAKLTGKHALP